MIEKSGQSGIETRTHLRLLQTAALTIKRISKVLLILTDTRLTLAQKAIRAELYACANLESRLIAAMTKLVSLELSVLEETDGKKLRRINKKLNQELGNFLQAADHSLNYLEQYFEHDFWMRLDDNQFAKQLSDILEKTAV